MLIRSVFRKYEQMLFDFTLEVEQKKYESYQKCWFSFQYFCQLPCHYTISAFYYHCISPHSVHLYKNKVPTLWDKTIQLSQPLSPAFWQSWRLTNEIRRSVQGQNLEPVLIQKLKIPVTKMPVNIRLHSKHQNSF